MGAEVVLVCYTTRYRGGSGEFAVAAQTLADELRVAHPRVEIRIEAMAIKSEFVAAMARIKSAGENIRELHFIGHSGMYGIMFGSVGWPEQFSPHEWRTMDIPFTKDAHAYFHACRTARWFAPFFARTFGVTTHGNQGYTTVSARKHRFAWAGFRPTICKKLYLVATPGRKSHGFIGSLRKYMGAQAEPMQVFTPQLTAINASYDKVAKLYDRAFADIRVREAEWRFVASRVDFASRVLDIGCGNGALLRALAQQIRSGVGVDASAEMITLAQERATQHTHLHFAKIEGPKLPFSEDSFDVVLSFLSFRYLDWDPMMAEIRRVLKPGGRLIIVDMVEKPLALSSLKEWGFLARSAIRHIRTQRKHPRFIQDLRALTSHPDWETMRTHNPIRAEHEYRWYLESRFPGSRLQILNVTRTQRIVAFDTGPLTKGFTQPLSYP